MNKPDIHLIALDLDGTLLTSQKQLSPRNLTALTRAAELGIEIVPATGRFYGGMPDFIRALPFLHYALTINGAQVCAVPDGEPICRAEIPWQDAVSLLRYLDKWDVTYDCYAENAAWITASMKARVHEYVRDPIYLSMIQRLREPVEDLAAFLTERRLDVQKVQVYPGDPEKRRALLRALPEAFPALLPTSSIAENIEINAAAANKGQALLALAAHLGLRPEQTMAFGDGLNDVTMLRDAGIGVAMGNASDELKALADCTTASCDEDGVAQTIEQFLL